jgi:hypothetical protein
MICSWYLSSLRIIFRLLAGIIEDFQPVMNIKHSWKWMDMPDRETKRSAPILAIAIDTMVQDD